VEPSANAQARSKDHSRPAASPAFLSRFEQGFGQEPHLTLLREVFDNAINPLGLAVDDLGRQTAGDASGLGARHEKNKKSASSEKSDSSARQLAQSDLPQPCGGRKEYSDESGKVVKVVERFGYKFHLPVDIKHEHR
jgi:hypothetical protein